MTSLRFVPMATVLALACSVAPLSATSSSDDGPAVYLKLVEAAPVAFEEVTSRIEGALIDLGWTVLAPLDCGVDAQRCSFRSHVMTAVHPDYVDRVMAHGSHAAFAVPIRFAVFEDEFGIHVSATNPANLNRTIVDEESSPEDWSWAVEMVRDVGRVAFPDHSVTAEYGQHRENARIGRTLGVMAGGAFTDKIEPLSTLPSAETTPSQVADLLLSFMESVDGDWEWEIHPIYALDLPEYGVSVLGISGGPMEAKAFNIVGSGGNDARDDLSCPGIDHAPAFPIELLVALDGEEVTVSMVDEMYRMKMFFEDAGKWAFAKNMGMPGSIEDEIKRKVQGILN